MSWTLVYTHQAQRDARWLAAVGLKAEAETQLAILARNPFAATSRFERLVGHLSGAYTRRIDVRHRLVYEVFRPERTVKVVRMWTGREEPRSEIRRPNRVMRRLLFRRGRRWRPVWIRL